MDIASIAVGSPGIASGATQTPAAGKLAGGFGDTLTRAIGSLDQLQKQPEELGTRLAAGEPIELHDVMLAQERASLSMQLAVQVRNKLVEAYQDVMRTQL